MFLLFISAAWTVHIDHAQDPPEFEKAVTVWSAFLKDARAHHGVPPPGANRLTFGAEHFTFTPLKNFAVLDQPSALKLMPEEKNKLASLDLACDIQVRDHHSEIWQQDDDFFFLASQHPSGAARMTEELISANGADDYNAAVTAFTKAVAKENKVSIVWFWPMYGSGWSHWICTAKDSAALADCDPEAVLVRALGADQGHAMLGRWKKTLLQSKREDGRWRPDLIAQPMNLTWTATVPSTTAP